MFYVRRTGSVHRIIKHICRSSEEQNGRPLYLGVPRGKKISCTRGLCTLPRRGGPWARSIGVCADRCGCGESPADDPSPLFALRVRALTVRKARVHRTESRKWITAGLPLD